MENEVETLRARVKELEALTPYEEMVVLRRERDAAIREREEANEASVSVGNFARRTRENLLTLEATIEKVRRWATRETRIEGNYEDAKWDVLALLPNDTTTESEVK